MKTEDDVRELVTAAVLGPDLWRATFAGPQRGEKVPWVRVAVRPVELRTGRHLQFSYFDGRKTETKNHPPDEASEPLGRLLDAHFAGIHLSTREEEIDIRTSKKSKVTVGRRRSDNLARADDLAHNRAKDLPLPEGRADRVLEVMGVLTASGRVRPAMRAKFTQINEFLKHMRHGLRDAGLPETGQELRVLDCGCGASHLTLAAHHYLSDVLGIPSRLLGVDVNDDLIRKSVDRATGLNGPGPTFTCGRIAGVDMPADIVIALHACDTATDDALAQAVRCEAKLVLCSPCCHRHLNRQLRPDGPASVLRPMLRHGILRERLADQLTDAFRALALRVMGYRAEVVEFVSPEHTARNLLIRAVRGAPAGETAFVEEYRSLKEFWGVIPYIEEALGYPFRRKIEPAG